MDAAEAVPAAGKTVDGDVPRPAKVSMAHPVRKIKAHSIQTRTKMHRATQRATDAVSAESPLVFLLGFNGSHLRNLKRFIALYTEAGMDVVSFTPTLFDTYSHAGNDLVASQLWLILIKECSATQRPVLFHVFSGSVYPFYRLMFQAKHGLLEPHIPGLMASVYAGVCFDSTPIDPLALIAADAALGSVPRPLKHVARLPTAAAIYTYWFATHDHAQWRRDFWTTLTQPVVSDAPVMVLYAPKDVVTDVRIVERFLAKLRAARLTVHAHSFPTSRHVAHLKTAPKKYQSLVTAWVQDSMLRHSERRRAIHPRALKLARL